MSNPHPIPPFVKLVIWRLLELDPVPLQWQRDEADKLKLPTGWYTGGIIVISYKMMMLVGQRRLDRYQMDNCVVCGHPIRTEESYVTTYYAAKRKPNSGEVISPTPEEPYTPGFYHLAHPPLVLEWSTDFIGDKIMRSGPDYPEPKLRPVEKITRVDNQNLGDH